MCGYQGARSTFLVHPFKTEVELSDTALLQMISDDFARTMFSVGKVESGTRESVLVFARLLRKWGFLFWDGVDPRDQRDLQFRNKCMAFYMRSIGEGIVKAVFSARVQIEKERVAHERTYSS